MFFDLWRWTFAAYRLWRVETMYQIWTQLNNLRRSYCDFSFSPNIEHVVSVALGSGIVFTKFDLRQLTRSWIIAFLMLVRYVKLWPWPLTSRTWTFTALWMSCVWTLCKIWAKSNNPRLSYRRFSAFTRAILGGGSELTELSEGCVDPTSPNLAGT